MRGNEVIEVDREGVVIENTVIDIPEESSTDKDKKVPGTPLTLRLQDNVVSSTDSTMSKSKVVGEIVEIDIDSDAVPMSILNNPVDVLDLDPPFVQAEEATGLKSTVCCTINDSQSKELTEKSPKSATELSRKRKSGEKMDEKKAKKKKVKKKEADLDDSDTNKKK